MSDPTAIPSSPPPRSSAMASAVGPYPASTANTASPEDAPALRERIEDAKHTVQDMVQTRPWAALGAAAGAGALIGWWIKRR